MRRPLTAAAALALTLGGVTQAGSAPAGPAAAAPLPAQPARLVRYDEAQLRAILADMGWKAETASTGKAPALGVWSKVGLPYQIAGVQCADAAGQTCEAIRLRYRNTRAMPMPRGWHGGSMPSSISCGQPTGPRPAAACQSLNRNGSSS